MRSNLPTHNEVDMLRRMRLFHGLSETDISEVAQHSRIRFVDRGEVLFEKGDTANFFYGVITGWVKLYNHRLDGTETVLGLFTQGETFAEATLFLGGTYPAIAEIVTPARLFEFEREYFTERVLGNKEMCLGMFGSLSMHLHRLTREVEQLQNRSSDQRLARFLLMLCAQDQEQSVVHLPYEKSLIAARLGIKPETLSRNFAKLKSCGVHVNRDLVTINDIKQLRSYCA